MTIKRKIAVAGWSVAALGFMFWAMFWAGTAEQEEPRVGSVRFGERWPPGNQAVEGVVFNDFGPKKVYFVSVRCAIVGVNQEGAREHPHPALSEWDAKVIDVVGGEGLRPGDGRSFYVRLERPPPGELSRYRPLCQLYGYRKGWSRIFGYRRTSDVYTRRGRGLIQPPR